MPECASRESRSEINVDIATLDLEQLQSSDHAYLALLHFPGQFDTIMIKATGYYVVQSHFKIRIYYGNRNGTSRS
jgi:hypothetical protein